MKIWDEALYNPANAPDPQYEKIAELLYQYNCEHHCYTMTGSDQCHRAFHKVAPAIHRCVGWDGNKDPLSMPRRAKEIGAEKIQLSYIRYFNQNTIDLAKANGIFCNIFFADDPEEACRYIDMGIDTILTNDYLRISSVVKDHLKNSNIPSRNKTCHNIGALS